MSKLIILHSIWTMVNISILQFGPQVKFSGYAPEFTGMVSHRGTCVCPGLLSGGNM